MSRAERARRALGDRLVVPSFDRVGYLLHRRRFRPEDLEVDLTGKVCAVTGATSGLGLATCGALAARGAELWLLGRDEERLAAAAEQVREASGREADRTRGQLHERNRPGTRDRDRPRPPDPLRVHTARLEVSSLVDLRAFPARFPPSRLDVLVHNAGVLPPRRVLTAEGLEQTVAVHLVGPFLLTWLLLPRLRAAGRSRVVFVSSGGMYSRRLDVGGLAALASATQPYDGVRAYAATKRAQVVLAELLAERLAGDGVTVSSMHPGWADTPGVRRSLPRFWRLTRPVLRSPAEGADTIVWLAACPRLDGETGRFWFDRAPRPTHLVPWTRESPEERAALGRFVCARAGVSWP